MWRSLGLFTLLAVATAQASITMSPVSASASAQAQALVSATNVPARGLNFAAAPVPPIMQNLFYTFGGNPNGGNIEYATNTGTAASDPNFMRYMTNAVRIFKTNGLYAAGLQTFVLDGGWVQDMPSVMTGGPAWMVDNATRGRNQDGTFMANTNIFDRFGFTITQFLDMAHTNGFKVMAYAAATTNICHPPSSTTQTIYNDVKLLMAMGFDGCKFDMCETADTTPQSYFVEWRRLLNQGMNDFYNAVAKTNGPILPFMILQTSSRGETHPNFHDSESLLGVNMPTFQPTVVISQTNAAPWEGENRQTNLVHTLREIERFRLFTRPGSYAYTGIGVYGNTPGNGYSDWTNFLAYAVLGCQPIELGLGTYAGLFSTVDLWENTYWPNISPYLTNHEVMVEMLQDPLVVPATRSVTNEWVEVWHRPMANGDRIVGITSTATTNRTITVSTADCGLAGGTSYALWDPFGKRVVTRFRDSFSFTIGARSLALFRIKTEPRVEKSTVSWTGLTISGTGTSRHSVSAQGPTPFFSTDGLTQSAANIAGGWVIPLPNWAHQVTVIGNYYSAYAGTVAWTNHPYLDYYHPQGRVQRDLSNDPINVPETTVVCSSGVSVLHTNVVKVQGWTNCPKALYLQMNASSNASARYLIGPLTVIVEE